MSLLVAVPCGIAAAFAYGASTAVEHSAANTGTGQADAQGLVALLRNPRWLMGMAGDTLGLILQVIALSTGPVVLIQPLLVLALPISLPIGWLIGGPRPGRSEYLLCGWIIAGLAVFFVIIGDPGSGQLLAPRPALIAILVAAVVGAIACAVVRHQAAAVRALVYGGVAGAWFGLVGVLLDASVTTWRERGIHGFAHVSGFMPVLGVLVVGALSIVLTQVSFQVGSLGASFPANLAAAPIVAVILGAVLLREHVPSSTLHLLGYAGCLAAIILGSIQLADDQGGEANCRSADGPPPLLDQSATGHTE
jgi:drug/metabolite transporter (DMT)-like permease